MKLTSDTFSHMEFMPDECAFGLLGPDKQYQWGANRNPHFTWSNLPKGAKSLVLVNDDLDVPVKLDTFNKDGSVVAKEQERRSLCHWLLVDLDPAGDPIRSGEFSEGVTIGGKPGPKAARGTRQGINEYTDWFKNDVKMRGDYFGYDGPCPPWQHPFSVVGRRGCGVRSATAQLRFQTPEKSSPSGDQICALFQSERKRVDRIG